MRLPVRAPFHLEATVRLLQRRPSNRVDLWERDAYRRVLRTGSGHVVCAVRNLGSIDDPVLDLSLEPRPSSEGAAARVARVVSDILGLGEDPSFAVAAEMPRLRAVERALWGARPPRFPSLFESFCRVVPYQQLSLEAGGVLVNRFVERFGRRVDAPSGVAWAFPEPEEVATAPAGRFAGIGFSRTKMECLKNVAALVSSGELRAEEIEQLPTDEALRRLDALPGIGPWSAALVLLRGFRRMDVFPADDVGVLRGLGKLVGAGYVARVVRRAGDRRGYLYFYSLGAHLLEAGLVHPAADRGAGAGPASP